MNTKLILSIGLLMIFTSSLFGQNKIENRFESVSNDYFKESIASGEYILLDVRTVEEYSEGHIDAAKLLDFNDASFNQIVESLPKDKKYLVYCASGVTSAEVMELMKQEGFTYVLHLENGFDEWE